MKMLSPAITCLMMTHGKPTLESSLRSLLQQTRLRDVQIIVIDSGVWLTDVTSKTNKLTAAAYVKYERLPNVEWYLTGEPVNAKTLYCPVAHWTNVAFQENLIRGRYFCTFYDDDRYAPTFMAKMAGYLDTHPECDAVRCSERWTSVDKTGNETPGRTLRAIRTLTKDDRFDSVVDGMQVMMRTSAVKRIGNPVMDDATGTCRHSDGVFFERLAKVIPQMDYIEDTLCEHRFTPDSTYTPS